ncbi:MAG TPA: hypothetical protein PLY00_17665, partial [Verrucomicrobiota bacterium]|nr:hypothetical protein [Bacillota bacterium]HOR73088.1 hypothetical protein [Verrucomicrobiota bacterium]HQK02326.1 hypothetical protein [Verrucomicrobiota bacterium]
DSCPDQIGIGVRMPPEYAFRNLNEMTVSNLLSFTFLTLTFFGSGVSLPSDSISWYNLRAK